MKKLMFLLLLVISTSINAQLIDYKNFNEKRMNDVMFNVMNKYVKYTHNGDSLSRIPEEKYDPKETNKTYSVGEDGGVISTNKNCKVCKFTYQEIAEKYMAQKKNNPNSGSRFFMDGDYKNHVKVVISSRFSSRSKNIYINFVYIYDMN